MQTKHLDTITRYLRSADPLLLVLGEKGSGKTHLLTQTVTQTRVSRHLIRLQGSASIQPIQLAKVLSKHWAAKIHDKHARLESQLHEIILGLAKHEQECVLLIDDAHLLPFSVLAAISHLAMMQDNMRVHLHIILSGRPSLQRKIQNLQAREIPLINLSAPTSETTITPINDNAGEQTDADWAEKIAPRFADTLTNTIAYNRVKIMSAAALLATLAFMWWFFQTPHSLHSTPVIAKHVPAPTMAQLPTPQQTQPIHRRIAKQRDRVLIAAATNGRPSSVIKAMQAEGYMLQLMSGKDKKAINHFIRNHHLNHQAHTISTELHHQSWYLLAYGHFAKYDQAQRALKKLPADLQKLHPWIRPDRSIKSA